MGRLLDSSSTSYYAGRIAGRLIFLVVLPVFVIALIYWLTGRTGPTPMRFSHAVSRWWVWVAGLLAGIVLLLTLSFSLASSA
jgi:uncharacterized membrane protein YdcZ (DUF606 family)